MNYLVVDFERRLKMEYKKEIEKIKEESAANRKKLRAELAIKKKKIEILDKIITDNRKRKIDRNLKSKTRRVNDK